MKGGAIDTQEDKGTRQEGVRKFEVSNVSVSRVGHEELRKRPVPSPVGTGPHLRGGLSVSGLLSLTSLTFGQLTHRFLPPPQRFSLTSFAVPPSQK